MITDTDIKKLKGVFATKADLKRSATKADLKKLVTKTEFSELKGDVKKLDERTIKLDERTVRIAEKVQSIEARLDTFYTKEDLENGLRETTDVLLTAMDKIAQGMDVMKHEYTAIGLKLDRHINDKSMHHG